MLTCTSTPATKTGRISAAALAMLVCVGAHATAPAGADSADALPARAPLYGYFREARGKAPVRAHRTVNFNEIRPPVDDPVPISRDGARVQPTVLARLHYAFASDVALSGERASQSDSAVLMRNSDAFVRAKVRLTLGKKWLGFVYADMGAAESALKWQGMAGVRGGHGVNLLAGWRHVTYHFSPGIGFDSLDFNGPFLGATLAW
jgi:hypothetical protein